MAHSNQAKKRIRQNERARVRNKSRASVMRTWIKKVMTAAEAGQADEAKAALPTAYKTIDKAANANIIHRNEASRRKSQLVLAVLGARK